MFLNVNREIAVYLLCGVSLHVRSRSELWADLQGCLRKRREYNKPQHTSSANSGTLEQFIISVANLSQPTSSLLPLSSHFGSLFLLASACKLQCGVSCFVLPLHSCVGVWGHERTGPCFKITHCKKAHSQHPSLPSILSYSFAHCLSTNTLITPLIGSWNTRLSQLSLATHNPSVLFRCRI